FARITMPAAKATGWMVSGINRARRYGSRLTNEPDAHTTAKPATAGERIAEMAGRQGSPYTGKLSARPAGKPGDFFIVEGKLATFPSTPPYSASAKNHTRHQYAFSRAWRNLSGPMGFKFKNQIQNQIP